MKNYFLILAIIISFSFYQGIDSSIEPVKKELTFNEKATLLKYFDETAAKLEQEVKGLNEAQLKYKPSEEAWSISQCLEHLIATEKMLFGMTKEVLEKPENPERKAEVKMTDDQLIGGITDRKAKFKAPAELQPQGIYTSTSAALKDFKKQRKEIQSYIKKSKANLRNYVSDSPAGAIDGHQNLLFLAAHTARHTAQIAEVKSQPGYPK